MPDPTVQTPEGPDGLTRPAIDPWLCKCGYRGTDVVDFGRHLNETGHVAATSVAKLRDLATVDLMLDHVQRLVVAYQSHADGLAIKLPERATLDQCVDIIVGAVEAARQVHRDLVESVREAAR